MWRQINRLTCLHELIPTFLGGRKRPALEQRLSTPLPALAGHDDLLDAVDTFACLDLIDLMLLLLPL